MTVLRDFYCIACGTVVPDLLDEPRELQLRCKRCNRERTHLPLCNGGCGNRYRFNDFPDDPLFYDGQVTSSVAAYETSAKTGDPIGPAMHHASGAVIHEGDRFVGDGKLERRDRYHHSLLTRAGRNRIYSTR